PGTVIADAGYGSEENYAYLEGEAVRAIVKYNTYHKEKTKVWKKDISKLDNWQYDEAKDSWICPAGRRLTFIRESKEKNESGYEVRKRHYRSTTCAECLLKASCTKAS
ncbi:transposase, partial [Paenibacillus sp. MBLB2552]